MPALQRILARLYVWLLLLPLSLLPTAQAAEILYPAIDPSGLKPLYDKEGESLPTLTGSSLRQHPQVYKTETVEAVVNPRSEMEFMTKINQGEVVLYQWETSEPLYFDFHGHQHDGNPDVWTRYAEGKTNRDQGSLVTPYTGEHGWYWANLGTKPVTIKLTISGYYELIYKIDLTAEAQKQ